MKDRKAFLLRLPPELHAQLRAWAAQEMRSLNAQIEFLLRQSLRARRGGREAEEDPEEDAEEDAESSAEDPKSGDAEGESLL